MRDNPVKHRLAQGEVVLGTMAQEFASPALFRLAAGAGAEFLILDQEHTSWGLETIRAVIAAGAQTDVVPIVRVPDAQYHLVARTLDLGALGVIIPNCDSEAEARAVVDWAKYPPLGRRGFGIPRYDREPGGIGPTIAKANAEQMVIALIETTAGLAEVERIAAVDGVDLLWIGALDLTTSLGIPGQFGSVLFQEAVERILSAGEKTGKAVGSIADNVEDARAWLERGVRCLAYGMDTRLYEDALSAGLRSLRSPHV